MNKNSWWRKLKAIIGAWFLKEVLLVWHYREQILGIYSSVEEYSPLGKATLACLEMEACKIRMQYEEIIPVIIAGCRSVAHLEKMKKTRLISVASKELYTRIIAANTFPDDPSKTLVALDGIRLLSKIPEAKIRSEIADYCCYEHQVSGDTNFAKWDLRIMHEMLPHVGPGFQGILFSRLVFQWNELTKEMRGRLYQYGMPYIEEIVREERQQKSSYGPTPFDTL